MLKKILLFVLLIGAIGVCTGIYLWNKPPEKIEDKKSVVVTAGELAAAYNNNEQEANEKYLNKAIEVSGIVVETEENQDGGLMIVLDTGDPIAGIQCGMREKGVTVEKGQTVTVAGFCSGSGITGVTLTGCVLKK